MFRLAHLSDPHIPPDGSPRRRELISKRALGWANWRNSRRHVHLHSVLNALTADMAGQHPDHIAVTGDLAIVSTQAEWQSCRNWLHSIGRPEDVSLVPGNHDAYTRRAISGMTFAWRDYMTGDPDTATRSGFPYLRRRGPIAIIGCSSAVISPPFMATGRVGREQLSRLRPLLKQVREEGLFRVVLIHHPPLRSHRDRYRRLIDTRAFARMLSDAGAELILHGHEHTATVRWTPGPVSSQGSATLVPVIGVPSASAIAHGHRPAAQYNLYEIGGKPGAWTCLMRTRGYGSGGLNELQDRMLFENGQAIGQPPTG